MRSAAIMMLATILCASVRTGLAQCNANQAPWNTNPGYWGDGTGDVAIICGTTGRVTGTATNLQLTRGQARHITTLPVGTTDFEITMFATSDVDTLLMRGCGSSTCPGDPNYGACIAGYRCENYCGWSK